MRFNKGFVVRTGPVLLAVASLALTVGCGGGSSSGGSNKGGGGSGGGPSGNNVQAIAVNLGPLKDYANGVFTSVTICAPGTSNCQTITDVLVDTGSYGLRVLATANDPQGGLTLSLPAVKDTSGNPFGECTQFADGSFLWGGVKSADVKMGGTSNAGEAASNIPINVVGDSSFSARPTNANGCTGTRDANSLQALGAHGILGIGVFSFDCGDFCVKGSQIAPPTPPTGLYYSCPSTGCVPSFVPLAQQVINPVAAFATDNNGVILELPAVGSTGAPTANGSMVFGIGTQSNNALPATPHIFSVNGFASFRTNYKMVNYGPDNGQAGSTSSYIDSGSNGLFFPDSLTHCSGTNSAWYCANMKGLRGTQSDLTRLNLVSFDIADATTLFGSGNAAFNNLGGTNTGVFDWGLPFFYGRNVYNAIAGTSTPASVATPYWAY